jgi:sugar phosphate isomerase/epimerase
MRRSRNCSLLERNDAQCYYRRVQSRDIHVNRRRFLAGSVAFAAALRAQGPQTKFPVEPRRRLSVSTYPFRTIIKSPHRHEAEAANATLTLQEFAASIPQRFQVYGIEPWSPHFESTDPDYVSGLSAAFKQAGVRVVDIPVDAAVRPCSPEAEVRKASLETWEKWVDAAVILGSPSIRVHLPEHANDDCVLTMLNRLVEYGTQKRVVINLENDDPRSEEAFHVVKVIEQINSPYLHALPDFCNSRLVGDEEYTYRALTAMFAHAYNISHVKDEESDEGKTYRVDVARVFAIAKKAGYRGYFSMEWEGQGDPYEGTKRLLEQSLKNLS